MLDELGIRLVTNLEVFLFDSWTTMMLMSKVLQCLFHCCRVVQHVDNHVQSVEDADTVCCELTTLWMLNVHTLECLLHLRLRVCQSSFTITRY